jgi:hypothetical protein
MKQEVLSGKMGVVAVAEGLGPTTDSAVISCSNGSDSIFRTFLSPLYPPQFTRAKKRDKWQQPVRRRGCGRRAGGKTNEPASETGVPHSRGLLVALESPSAQKGLGQTCGHPG